MKWDGWNGKALEGYDYEAPEGVTGEVLRDRALVLPRPIASERHVARCVCKRHWRVCRREVCDIRDGYPSALRRTPIR